MKFWNLVSQQHLFFVYFLVVLTFSPLRIGFVQETATSPDVLRAKTDAERDAGTDLNPYRWIGYGCLISCAGTGIAGMTKGGILTRTGVYLLTTSAAITEVYYRQHGPPSQRFIGKPPEYINTYISTYKAESGSRQAKWAAAGCLGGTCINGAILAVALYAMLTFALRPE